MANNRRPGWLRVALLNGVLLATGAGAARAQVIEIADDGSVTTYDRPMQFDAAGARAIAAPARPSRPAVTAAAAPSPAVDQAITAASARHGLDRELVAAVAWRESGFNPAAMSPKGARGVMQLMPQTARALGVDPSDAIANIDGGADYLSRMLRRFNGDRAKALAAYNAGPEAVERYGGTPPYAETIAYVRAILDRIGKPTGAGARTVAY